ncbi:MAG: YggT family protein [Candidatus Riflebacteria bacterium]|nr:YggT family protein [Candidatus Riflebacteria bacterium]
MYRMAPSSTLGDLVGLLFNAFELLIVVRVLCSWLPVNRCARWYVHLYRVTEPVLAAARRVLPPTGGVDYSPILAFFALDIVRMVVLRTLYSLP